MMTKSDAIAAGADEAVESSDGRDARHLRRIRGLIALLLLLLVAWGSLTISRARRTKTTAEPSVPTHHVRQIAGRFDYSDARIPVDQIRAGGPPKDGIPALTKPRTFAAADAVHQRPDDRVIGFVHGQHVRAYPLRILNYHEIVNDIVGGMPIAVTYCPLCDSAAVFDRRVAADTTLEFGVSGLLYNSNVLMYDRGTNRPGLWSQLAGQCVTGRYSGTRLDALPVELTTWADWRRRYPQTDVLSPQTGHRRNYESSPYAGYFRSPQLMFPVSVENRRLPRKLPVLGAWTENAARAYPLTAFNRNRRQLEDTLDGKRITVEFDPESRTLRVARADDGVEWMYSLWFAWYAFRPETTIAQPDAR